MKPLFLFDIDCTLSSGPKGESRVYAEAIKVVYGIDTTIDVVDHHGMTDLQIFYSVLEKNGLAREIIDKKIEVLKSTVVKKVQPLIENGVILIDGSLEFLESIKSRAIIGTVTGNLEEKAWNKLKSVKLDHYFKFGGFGDESEDRNELVKIAIKKARKYGYNDGPIFHFGDTPRDIAAGNLSGATTIGIAQGGFSKQELLDTGADYAFNNLDPKILDLMGL